jgi:hypothetical protein
MIHIFGFVVIDIVGFDPRETNQGDIVIKVALS